MPQWLTEFQAFRAVVRQANDSPDGVFDYKKLVNEFIERFENAFVNGDL